MVLNIVQLVILYGILIFSVVDLYTSFKHERSSSVRITLFLVAIITLVCSVIGSYIFIDNHL